jgi:lysophospholipase L1-like esterase
MTARTIAVLALALVAAACRSGSPAGPAGPRYVVVGASDAAGYGADDPAREAWPRVVRAALPPGSAVVNFAVPGATVADALRDQVPSAVATPSDGALVWLSVNDLLDRVPPPTYEEQLRRLVGALRKGGSTRVLVGNSPPLDRLPGYLECRADPACRRGPLPTPDALNGVVDAYNAAIDRVLRAEGAELVDLHAATMAARAAGTEAALVSADGFHPSTAGHRTIADAFLAVLRRG